MNAVTLTLQSALAGPGWWVLLASLGGSVLLVLTQRWHGALSMDQAHGVQKFHLHPTPRVGGVPVALGLLLAAYWPTAEGLAEPGPLVAAQALVATLLLAGLPAFGFGLLEDLTKRVGVLHRLLATIAAGVLAWYISGVSLTRLGVPVLDLLMNWLPLSVAFTAVAIGGVANALNIVDGFNGLAAFTALLALAGLAMLAQLAGDPALALACMLVALAVLGFACVNWPAGKLFLGDGGSYLIGFALAWLGVLLVERNAQVSPFAVLLLCLHPINETLFSVLRRRARALSPGQPDRQHFHSLVKRRYVRRWLPSAPTWLRNAATGLLVAGMTLPALPLAAATYTHNGWAALACAALVLAYLTLYARMVRHRWCLPLSMLLRQPHHPQQPKAVKVGILP